MADIIKRLSEDGALTEKALESYLSVNDDMFPLLFDAMRYSVLGGGKRVRPFLALEFCRMFGGRDEDVMPFACALEMIHSYSLIHDDMPCMDNDELRRGKATTHKKFGEANALLAGDTLLTYAFEVASNNNNVSPDKIVEAVRTLSKSAGYSGMAGGQQLDLDAEVEKIDLDTLKYLHSLKTGALIKCACKLGCIAADSNEKMTHDAQEYANGIGLTFQIIDDILDETGNEQDLGKTVGSDADNGKTTFLTFMSPHEAFEYATKLTDNACGALCSYENNEILCDFAYWLLNRKN